MKTPRILKKVSLGLAALTVGLLISGTANAIPYTGDTTVASPTPAFNVFTGNMPAPAPTDGEPDFYQGRVPANGNLGDTNTLYADPVSTNCTNGEVLQMRVYVHNGASADANNNGSGPSVAHGTKVKVSLPGESTTASNFRSTATISANNAATVSDGLTINCNGQQVQLQYVKGSASQYSLGSGVLPLSDAITTSGVPIQSEKVPGDVWGCWNERVYVLLAVKVVVPPPAPQVTATCDLFTITASEDRKVTINQFKFTASNANFQKVVVNWGDSRTDTFTDSNSVVGQTHQLPSSPNTFNLSALVTFLANGGKTITSGGPGTACAQQVSFTPNQPPTIVTPPPTVTTPPTQLVNTGAGSVAGLFAGVTAIGAAGSRWFMGRRLGRQ